MRRRAVLGLVAVTTLAGCLTDDRGGDSTSTPSPTPVTFPGVATVEREIHEAVNEHRRANGLDALAFDDELAAVARAHSRDMIDRDFVGHEDPDGDGPAERVGDLCEAVGENIVVTYWDRRLEDGTRIQTVSALADDVLTSWLGSPSHRANLEDKLYEREGIGVAIDTANHGIYVTQNLCDDRRQ